MCKKGLRIEFGKKRDEWMTIMALKLVLRLHRLVLAREEIL